MRKRITAAAALALASALAHGQERTVDTVVPLLVEAVRLGDARGILGGQAAAFMASTFGATEPIVVTVRRLREIEPDGCARVHVTTIQANVVEPVINEPGPGEPTHNPPTDQRLVYEIDFCENGRIPAEGGGRL